MDIIIMMKKDIDYMKNNISFLILFSLLFYSSVLCANENSAEYYTAKRYSLIEPSPDVSSMMKYIDIPVNHFTGLPQINIPIYTIIEGNLSIPISLSYRGGGIKQNEQSGIISKGWTLMAGMTISRSICGLPDEYICGKGTQYEIRGLFNLKDEDKRLKDKIIAYNGDYTIFTPNDNITSIESECADYENGYVDFANDIFKFYGLGMSGTFMFDYYYPIKIG